MKWVRETSFVPSLWIAPLAADKKGCEAAKGRFVEGVVHGYEEKPNKQGGKNHFYKMIVSSSNVGVSMMWDSQNNDYVEGPYKDNEMYSIKASGLLHFLLAKFMANPFNVGRPCRITYDGTKPVEVDSPQGKITSNVHQWTLESDAEYVPQLTGPQAAALGHEAAEEPLPPLE